MRTGYLISLVFGAAAYGHSSHPPESVDENLVSESLEVSADPHGVHFENPSRPSSGWRWSTASFSRSDSRRAAWDRTSAVPVINYRSVSPGCFKAIGTPILRGRGILPSDDANSPPVVVIDETVARQYWPGGDAIGKRIRTSTDSGAPWFTIVGVAPNVKHASLRERPNFEMYRPLAQSPSWSSYIVMRISGAPEGLVTGLRRRVAELDPALPVSDVQTLEGAMAESLSVARLTNFLLTAFAGLALLLAVVGIYGVMSLNVNGRLGEFGVRLALGAGPRDVLSLVMRQGLLLALAGLAIGVVGALVLTRFLGTLLFEVSAMDPLTFVSVGGILSAAAIAACYIPARRATRADPIAAFRRD